MPSRQGHSTAAQGHRTVANTIQGYACRPGILPLQEKLISSERVFSKEQTIKCRGAVQHSSLRVTIERGFAALKNRFKILDQNYFTLSSLK
jgi:hypothetical protein